MVFVRRNGAPSNLLKRHEYRVIRPDDLAHLERRLLDDPSLFEQAVAESIRALDTSPESARARHIATALGNRPTDPEGSVIVP